VSAKDVWAVGGTTAGTTLIEHSNGHGWKIVASPNPSGATFSLLYAVAAVSAKDIWAAGYYQTSSGDQQTLIEQWNGTKWSQVPSPNPTAHPDNSLYAVYAVSASNVWAAGTSQTPDQSGSTLIEHWNGTSWKRVASPSPKANYEDQIEGLDAVSANDVWAVGYHEPDATTLLTPITEQWNGHQWKIVKSPIITGGLGGALLHVSAISASDVWAIGFTFSNEPVTIAEHWNGHAWKIVRTPNGTNALYGMYAVSPNDVWAVGGKYSASTSSYVTVIEQWNGNSWKVVASPNPGGKSSPDILLGVSGTSATNIWAVGVKDYQGSAQSALIEHWDGHQWEAS
jgi:hypothetical protein